MKGFAICIVIVLLLQLNVTYSQDTVKIHLRVGRLIVQDLTTLDELKVRTILLEANLKTYQEVIESQKLIIQSHAKTDQQNKEIIANINQVVILCQQDLNTVTKKYKGAVRLGRFYLVLAGIGAGFGIYQMIKN